MFAAAVSEREVEFASREELGCRSCSVAWEACAVPSAEVGSEADPRGSGFLRC